MMISVCIPNYNGFDLIDACIASVRNQDCAVLPAPIFASGPTNDH
jgi:glycosyltransferase involved in cell wall biosynthesis